METLKTAACWWNQINHCNNVRIMAKKWRASVNCKKLSYIYCASYRTRKTFKSFCCLILRDNLKIVVLTYFRGHWHYVWKNSRNHQGVCFRDLQKSGQMPNVFPEFKPTLINHMSITVDKILTIIVGLVFFISFQALVLSNCPLFSYTNFEATLKRSSWFIWWVESKTSNALFGDKFDFNCSEQSSKRPVYCCTYLQHEANRC